jgi:hypothetical protein
MSVLVRATTVALAVAAAWLSFANVARADIASQMTADLQQSASAVPNVSVSVGAPVGQETLLGQSPSVIAHVTFTAPQGNALSGILTDPSSGLLFTDTEPQIAIWELAVMEATKHTLAAGNTLDGVSVTENIAGQQPDPAPDLMVSVQGQEITAQPSSMLSTDDVKSRVTSALPAFAADAQVTVLSDAAGERVINVQLARPPDAFRAVPFPAILGILLEQQHDLAPAGADIGRVIVRISDVSTGAPLYVAAADGMMGVNTYWYSPFVQGYVAELLSHTPGSAITPTLGTSAGATARPATSVRRP